MAKNYKNDGPPTYSIIEGPFDLTGNKKLAQIKWGDNPPTFDIRRFTNEGVPMKGIGLNIDDVEILRGYIDDKSMFKSSKQVAIDLFSELQGMHHVVSHRKNGYTTINGKIKLTWKKTGVNMP